MIDNKVLVGVISPVIRMGRAYGVTLLSGLFHNSGFVVGDRVIVYLGALETSNRVSPIFRVTQKGRKILRLTPSTVGVMIDNTWRHLSKTGKRYHVYLEKFEGKGK